GDQILERRQLGNVERVELAEDLERRRGALDLLIDGHRDRAHRRDVLTLYVRQLPPPSTLHRYCREYAGRRDDRQHEGRHDPAQSDGPWQERNCTAFPRVCPAID